MTMALIILILGATFTAWSVDASFERGRLSSIPNYDDVTYFFSATTLLEAFHHSGLHGVAEKISQNSNLLHSPYSTTLAAAAFATLGYNDSAPYIFNFLVILLYLFFLNHIMRDLPLIIRFAMMVFFLTLPFATMAVVEFRPDPCWAVLIGFCAVFGISSRTYFDDWRQPAIHAMLFALSLLTKPSIFAMTIIIFGLSACYRFLMEIFDRHAIQWRVFARVALIYILVTLVVAGPYFIFFASPTWKYFLKNLFGANKGIWSYQGDWLQQFGYYLSGGSAASNLGNSGWAIGCFFAVGTVKVLARRDVAGIKLAGGLWIVVISTYLISSFAQMKSPFLGGAFYSTFIFASACLLNDTFKALLSVRFQSKLILTCVSVILAMCGIWFYQWPEYSSAMSSENGHNFKHIGETVISEISKIQLPQNSLIIFTQLGPVVWEDVAIWSLLHGCPIRADNLSFERDIDCFKKNIQDADIVFVQDKGMMGAFLRLPSEKFQEQFRTILNGDNRFKLFKKIKALDGKNVYFYINKRIETP
jgi:hypothetical protein